MIRLSDITKSYPDGENRMNHVLCGVNLHVREGEFVAVRGVSGSGKTTLLSVLGTLLPADSGSYLLNGVEVTSADAGYSEIRNKYIGFIFQDHRLLPQYTVIENVLLPTLAYAENASREATTYARELLELTGMLHTADRYPHTLSGGEACRVAVCRALVMKPLVLLADEPTGQLDAGNAANIADLLTEINRNLHTTIIMVTHSDETSRAANRTFTLREGRLQ